MTAIPLDGRITSLNDAGALTGDELFEIIQPGTIDGDNVQATLNQISAFGISGTAYTVATLPPAGQTGRRAFVTDADSPTFLGTLTGLGSTVCPVFDNGVAWVSA